MPEREIKFRGWHTTQKKMYSAETMASDQLTLLPTGEFINVNGMSTILSVIYPKDKFIPLQYTGLRDKKGVEIYEGDLIEWDDESNGEYWRVAIVEFAPDIQFRIVKNAKHPLSIKAGEIFRYGCFTYQDTQHHLTIIGNIYENPEILKEK